MAKKKKEVKKMGTSNIGCSSGRGGPFYGLGALGAAVYYIATATGFWNGVLGVLKAIVWPAFLVYEIMKSMGI